jgi:hypothetical protein
VTPILQELNWIPVKQQLFYLDVVFAFKCMKGIAPSYPSSQFTTKGRISGTLVTEALREAKETRGEMEEPLVTPVANPTSTFDLV